MHTLSEHFLYSVFTTLKGGVGLEVLHTELNISIFVQKKTF